MKPNLFCIKPYCCNGWCLSHFIMYMLLGYFAPKYIFLAIFIGFVFEIVEYFLEKRGIYITSNPMGDNITNIAGAITGYLLSPYPRLT